jgi:hypothetical protein
MHIQMKQYLYLFLLMLALSEAVAVGTVLDQGDAETYFGGSSSVSSGDNQRYLDWWKDKEGNNTFTHSLFLESTDSTNEVPHGAALHWKTNATHIHIAVAARATGWIGFGLSESGGMRGADMVLFASDDDNDNGNDFKLMDAHVLQDLYPIEDDCQNWELLHGIIEGGFVIFEAIRQLDTGDLQDRTFVDDSDWSIAATMIVLAWGDDSHWSYHGRKNRVKGAVRFFRDGTSQTEAQVFAVARSESEGVLELRANNFSIPVNETTYQEFCWDSNDLEDLGLLIDDALHGVGMDVIVDGHTRKYVHHFVLSGGTFWDRNSSVAKPFSCEDYFGPEIVFTWAPGDQPLVYPPDVGSPLGTGGFQSFQLQIHYNNPELDAGMEGDNSGVRILWTSKKRKYDAGVLAVGDPLTYLDGESVGSGLSSASFDCSSECSTRFLDEPVLVISESLHMHKSGVSATNLVKRDGRIVHEARVDYFDFEQRGSLAPQQQAYQIMAGDSFHSTCNYENGARENKTFGLSSQEEMCIVFMTYYPRKTLFNTFPFICGYGIDILGCGTSFQRNDHLIPSSLNRTFGLSINNGNCLVPSSQTMQDGNQIDRTSTSGVSSVSIVLASAMIGALFLLLC